MPEPVTKNQVIIIVGSMIVGLFGIATFLFTLIADHKISQMEARMADKFVLLREINDVKTDLAKLEAKVELYHLTEDSE